ncbi:MAG: inorganic phosphate transporter [Eubacterium sp.]|jgi:PiT family inorganic phosphate transporter|uniref:inorganic phosphate transporter n=1 Tax=Eubacterium sp. F2 TaxID=3381348 RepID=UPI00390817BC|nr:inorganic phosphate transporter [Eubacterium sp.]MCI2197675.1 inorganic phosphate transporter [Eubacterium sp.]
MIQLYFIIALALLFDFINGFHDTANAIATAVSTRAIRLRYAIIMAACMNFIGAVLFTGVAETIATGVVDLNQVKEGPLVMIVALLSAVLWNLATWYFGIPSSSSHALIGSLAGAALGDAGMHAVNFHGFITIFISLIASPLIAFCVGYLLFTIIKLTARSISIYRANTGLRRVQIFTAALQAFSHGSNDAQKSMGVITMALVSFGIQSQMIVPHWVQIACATAMTLGTSVGGWRIIKTVGTQIMKLKPINGVAADISSSLIIQIATHLDLPVSTTQVISSSIMGVGASVRKKGVKWGTAVKMFASWFITVPVTIAVSFVLFQLIHLFV